MLSLDKVAYISKFLKINPSEKITYSILTMFTVLVLNDIYISILVLSLMYISVVFLAGIENKIFFRLMSIPLIFLLISVVTILISEVVPEIEYVYQFSLLGYRLGFMRESLELGSKLFFKALASISCLYFIILTTPVIDIIYFLEKIKLPKILTEIIGLVYRYIFVLIEATQLIYVSQDSRLGYSTLSKSFASAGKLISSLLLKALKQADESFMSMEARCYNGEIKFLSSGYIYSGKNYIFIIAVNLSLILFHYLMIYL